MAIPAVGTIFHSPTVPPGGDCPPPPPCCICIPGRAYVERLLTCVRPPPLHCSPPPALTNKQVIQKTWHWTLVALHSAPPPSEEHGNHPHRSPRRITGRAISWIWRCSDTTISCCSSRVHLGSCWLQPTTSTSCGTRTNCGRNSTVRTLRCIIAVVWGTKRVAVLTQVLLERVHKACNYGNCVELTKEDVCTVAGAASSCPPSGLCVG